MPRSELLRAGRLRGTAGWPWRVRPSATARLELQHAHFASLPKPVHVPCTFGLAKSGDRMADLPLGGWKPAFPEMPEQPPDEYRLSLGKITDTLRLDYPDFFERPPDFSIYDEAVVLQLRKPWEEPKQLAGCRSTYVNILNAIRRFSKGVVRDGNVVCQVCDGHAYGCDLRVHWTCRGQVKILGSRTSFMISAISLYTLRRCSDASDEGNLAWRVHSHIIDVTEIRPCSLRQELMNFQATPQPEEA
ncbi:unnamed protein product [Effrenium voratum]|nr:unnamed protein product [Effrenium voratum]